MKKTIFLFGMGVIVGVCITSFFKREAKVHLSEAPAAEQTSKEQLNISMEHRTAAKEVNIPKGSKVSSSAPAEMIKAKGELPPEPQQEVAPDERPQTIDFALSEDQIDNMEQSLGDLQKDISLFRYKKGWLVRFHSATNLLSEIGVHDNDFIRFSQFESLKKNPQQEKLVSRLENILSSLER